MSTVGEYGAVCAAIKEINGDSDQHYNCETSALEVPQVWEQNFKEAEEAAQQLKGVSFKDFMEKYPELVESVCERTKTSSDEEALLLFASGEESVRRTIYNELRHKNASTASALEEVLESAFDGQLSAYWRKRHR